MSEPKEEQQNIINKEYINSIRLLGLPMNTLGLLAKIPGEELTKRDDFIRSKIHGSLEKLNENQFCIIPSILRPQNFTLVIKMNGKIKKMTGSMKEGLFEIHPTYGQLEKAKTLKECIERVILYHEKKAAVPLIFEAHRSEVESNIKEKLAMAIQDSNLPKIKSIFSYLNLKEMDETLLLKAFENSSAEVIDFFIDKLKNNELRFRQVEGQEHQVKEKFETILLLARKRAAKADDSNIKASEIILGYLRQRYPQSFTEAIELREKKMLGVFKALAELLSLNTTAKDFKERRVALEMEVLKYIDQLGHDINEVLNIKIGSEVNGNVHALDIAVNKGTPALVATFLHFDATPTVGWKYESLKNFEENRQTPLRYMMTRNERSEAERSKIVDLLSAVLKSKESKKTISKPGD